MSERALNKDPHSDLGRKCLHREGPELGLRSKAFCLISGISRLHKVTVIDPEEVIYVMFSIFP